MKSPFPGMDPFIESCGLWEDFHDDLIVDIKRVLAAATPDRYLVRTGERAYIVVADSDNGKTEHVFKPDVGLFTPQLQGVATATQAAPTIGAPATDTEPETILAFVEERFTEQFIEVYESEPELHLVTCIEVLSPSNKRFGTEGWLVYKRKRQAKITGRVNFVEIDLLRGGQKMPMTKPWPQSPYTLMLCRSLTAPYCKVWKGFYQRTLPQIPIPLAGNDPDVQLDLQPLIDAIYVRNRYARSIDYTKPATPPLSPEESAWLEQQLRR